MRPISLDQLPIGQPATLLKVRGDKQESTRMASMGLHIGFQLQVIEPPHGKGGAMLIRVGENQLMLGSGMAENIVVRQA